MQDLVPIKVRIGLAIKGGKQVHDFPNFNALPPEVRGDCDWSYFVDRFGGWHYDKVAGHADDDPEANSPPGIWWGMLLVPVDFADAAKVMFPEQVFEIDDATAEVFYDTRAHAHEPAVRIDEAVVGQIKARRDLGLEDDAHTTQALDEDHPSPGLRKNKTKTWAGYKAQRGVTIAKR